MFNKFNTLKLFFNEHNREFNVREVARILKISPPTASKELKNLSKEMLLQERKERQLHLYKSNLESDAYTDLKLWHNIRQIRESGLLQALNEYYLKPTVVLFGSTRYGLDTENSDFDLLILSEKTTLLPEVDRYETKIKRKIQVFAVKNMSELKNEHLIQNILNGITLQGEISWTSKNALKKGLSEKHTLTKPSSSPSSKWLKSKKKQFK